MAKKEGKRYVMTASFQLAMKLGYIGQVFIRPNFLAAVVRIHLGGDVTPPLHIYYAGHPDARLRKKFNLPEEVKDAYG